MKQITIFIAFLVFAVFSSTGSTVLATSRPTVLTFDEFQKLAAKDRDDYLETLRQFALKVERDNAEMEVQAEPVHNIWYTLAMATANAAGAAECVYAGYVLDTAQACGSRQTPHTWDTPNGKAQNLCAGSVVCNPMLYGFGPDGNGICTSNKTKPTVDCDTKYRAIKSYGGADIAAQLKKAGLGSKFNDQTTKVSKYCGDATASSAQASICKYVSARADYLKAKLKVAGTAAAAKAPVAKADANAEKAKEKKKADEKKQEAAAVKAPAVNDAQSKVTKTPPMPVPRPVAASTPTSRVAGGTSMDSPARANREVSSDQGSGGSSGGGGGSGSNAGAASTSSSAGQSTKSSPAQTSKKEAPKKPTDNCIRTAADYDALKDKLNPPALRNLKPNQPFYFENTSHTDAVTGAMSIVLSNDKMVVTSHILPPTGAGAKILIATHLMEPGDDKVIYHDSPMKSVCILPNNNLALTFDDGEVRYAKMSANGLKVSKKLDSSDGLEMVPTSKSKFDQLSIPVKAAYGQSTGVR